MNSTHATVGIGATSAMAAVSTLLDGFHGMTGQQADAAAWLLVTGLGAVYAMIAWYIAWRWPTAPALPGEFVALPPNTPAVPVAQVQAPEPPPPAPAAAPVARVILPAG